MPISIEGKRIIVTGGASGIAAAAVAVLTQEGASVVSFDVNDAAGERVAKEATATGPGTATYLHVDVSQRAEVFEAVDDAVGELGGLDAFFNVAGIERHVPAEDMTEEELDQVLGVNLKGTVFTNQAAFHHLKERGGSIANFGSDAGLMAYPNGAHYSASKGAVISYTRTVAHEWGKYGIRVNAVVPTIWTEMYDEYRARMSPEELAAHDVEAAIRLPLGGRLGDPTTDLAPVLVFLASEASKFISGQIISVTGASGTTR